MTDAGDHGNFAQVQESLRAFRDKVALKAKLGQMELRDSWQAVERQGQKISDNLEAFGAQMRMAKDDLVIEGHLALLEAKERWQETGKAVTELATAVKAAGAETRESFDHARLQAHLAKLEAADFYADLKGRYQNKFSPEARSQQWQHILLNLNKELLAANKNLDETQD